MFRLLHSRRYPRFPVPVSTPTSSPPSGSSSDPFKAPSQVEPISGFRYFELLIILGTLQAIAPVSIDMYLAAMPAMETYFQTNAAAVQATMVMFLGGFALGQLLWGPLTDRFGRKKPTYDRSRGRGVALARARPRR